MSYQCFKTTVVTCVILLCLLLGLGIRASIPHKNDTGDKSVCSTKTLYRISDTELIYDDNTKVVYYCLYNGFMSPYYNEHGQLCRYVDGKIIPIEQGD